MTNYETIIGLEIHAELDTNTKAFCSCRNQFGALPNTQVCPVCLGLPGALPSINRRAVEYTIMGGLSFGCDINHKAIFERKNYYYPDLPKGYQITQVSSPLCSNGGIRLDSGKFIRFDRIHLEEDTAKIINSSDSDELFIDYNRAGLPIIEMVTLPDMSCGVEAVEFISKLKQTLMYSGVSKCRAEEGGFRFDVNISVRKKGEEKLNSRCELKNLVSLKDIELACEYESNRQIQLLENGQNVDLESRGWNSEICETYPIREKQTEYEYRYLPDPDIMPIEITDKDIKRLKSRLPEVIESRNQKLIDLGLNEYDANIILEDKEIYDYYMSVIGMTGQAKETANWIITEILRVKKDNQLPINSIISAEDLAMIIDNVVSEDITRVNAKILFDEVINTGKSADILIKELGLYGSVNKKDIVDLVGMLINEKPNVVEDYVTNPEEVLNYFIGNIIKHTAGKAKVEYIKPLIIGILEDKK